MHIAPGGAMFGQSLVIVFPIFVGGGPVDFGVLGHKVSDDLLGFELGWIFHNASFSPVYHRF